jgi:hypothetical protein
MVVTSLFGVTATAAGAKTPPPPQTLTCTGTLSSPEAVPAGTYKALILPAGSICVIPGPKPVTVLTSVTIQAGAALATGFTNAGANVKIVGSLTLEPGSIFIAGLNSEKHPVNILGRVTVMDGAVMYLGTEKPGKPPFATIQGSVTATDPSAVVIQNTAIGGPVKVSGGGSVNSTLEVLAHGAPDTNYTDFEDDQINGGITETGYGGVWGGVIRTIMKRSLVFSSNMESTIDEYDIGSDIIGGSVQCSDNVPPPNLGISAGSPSIVHGRITGDQGNTCTGVATGGTGPPG